MDCSVSFDVEIDVSYINYTVCFCRVFITYISSAHRIFSDLSVTLLLIVLEIISVIFIIVIVSSVIISQGLLLRSVYIFLQLFFYVSAFANNSFIIVV